MRIQITDKDMGMARLIKDLKQAKISPFVKIGLLANTGKMNKKSSDSTTKSIKSGKRKKLTVLDVGIYNEFGTEINGKERIPQRSFIRTTYNENKSKYYTLIKSMILGFYMGRVTLKQILEVVGLMAVSDTKKTITHTHPSWKENAKSTVKKKKSSKPLIDTGQLVGSIHHQVVMSGK